MHRTASTSRPACAVARAARIDSRSVSVTPDSARTLGSMSRGSARSSRNTGRPARARIAAVRTFAGSASPVAPGFGARSLADPKRMLKHLVQHPPGGRLPPGDAVRRAQLAEDLRLTDDHGVQTAGHREQVLDGPVLVVYVEVLGQGLQRQSADRRQQVGDLADTTVELVHVGEDLDPVAGGEHDRLSHRVAVPQRVQRLRDVGRRDRHPLEHPDRGAVVAQTDDEDTHACTACRGLGDATGDPVDPVDGTTGGLPTPLRCSWKAKICNSTDRSTLRTSTPGGTARVTGAKFRMLVTPAATSRSQTSCAAAAGVVMTPIDARRLRTISARSSTWRTGRPATSSPMRSRSASNRPTTRNPREANPP